MTIHQEDNGWWQHISNNSPIANHQENGEENKVERSEWIIMQGVMWSEVSRHNIHIQGLYKPTTNIKHHYEYKHAKLIHKLGRN